MEHATEGHGPATFEGSGASLERRFEFMVDHMRDGLLLLDEEGGVLAANAASRQILRLSRGDDRMEGGVINRILGFDPLATLEAAGRAVRMEFWVDGVPYQAELTPSGRGACGSGCVVAFREVSEEKRVDQMKSELINVASHELRTPLTAVNNALDLLANGRLGTVSERQRHFLELAKRNVTHLMDMVNDLLDSAKIESGKVQIEREPLDIADVVAATRQALSPQAEARRIVLDVRIEPDLPVVYGKASMLERVLINLLGNAVKFTPEHGSVELTARSGQGGAGTERFVELVVTDTGPGIPGDQLESIFDRFHQVGRSKGQEVAGTGLGLAIARELVLAHHGRIWAESPPGRGASFFVRIPVLSETEFFRQQLERELVRARRLPIPLALVSMRLANAGELRRRLDATDYARVWETLAEVATRTTYRSTDKIFVLREHEELAAILLDTPREGGLVFARRLSSILEAESPFTGLRLACGCATFPNEAVTAERLYELAQPGEEA